MIEKYFFLKTKNLNDYITTIESEIDLTGKTTDVTEETVQKHFKRRKGSISNNSSQRSSSKNLKADNKPLNLEKTESDTNTEEKKIFYLNIASNRTAIRKTTIYDSSANNNIQTRNIFRNNVKYNRFELKYNQKRNVFEYYYLIKPFETIVENFTDLISLVIFTDVNIYERNPSNEIFGRVNKLGGKIAIISLNNELDSETIITCLHETIHTFGISHCCEWDCIMNSKNDINGYSSIDICPLDLMKLKFYNWDINIRERYAKLKEVYETLGWKQDALDCQEKINLIDILFSKE